MKAVVAILSIVAFVACLLIGIQIGSGSLHFPDSSGKAAQATPDHRSPQRTLLFISVDDLEKSEARLAGLWIVLYRPDTPRLMIMPLYPPSGNPDHPTEDLAKKFALNPDHSPSSSFFESVRAFHFNWDGYMIVDSNSIAGLIDNIQGIAIDNNFLNGTAAAASLKMPWDNPADALTSQKVLGTALCSKLANLPPKLDWKMLTKNISSQHFRMNFSIDQLNADWKRLSMIDSPISCDFPSP